MNATIVKMGKCGRIHIPASLKDNLGSRFIITRLDDKLILTSIPEDPVQDLEEIGKSIPDKTIKELRKEILEEAYNDIR